MLPVVTLRCVLLADAPIILFSSDAGSVGFTTGILMEWKFAVIIIPPIVQKEDPSDEDFIFLL